MHQIDADTAVHFMAVFLLQVSEFEDTAFAYLKEHLLGFHIIGGIVSLLLIAGTVMLTARAFRIIREQHEK